MRKFPQIRKQLKINQDKEEVVRSLKASPLAPISDLPPRSGSVHSFPFSYKVNHSPLILCRTSLDWKGGRVGSAHCGLTLKYNKYKTPKYNVAQAK